MIETKPAELIHQQRHEQPQVEHDQAMAIGNYLGASALAGVAGTAFGLITDKTMSTLALTEYTSSSPLTDMLVGVTLAAGAHVYKKICSK